MPDDDEIKKQLQQNLTKQAQRAKNRAARKTMQLGISEATLGKLGGAYIAGKAAYDVYRGEDKAKVAKGVAKVTASTMVPHGRQLFEFTEACVTGSDMDQKNTAKMYAVSEFVGKSLGAMIGAGMGSVFPFYGTAAGAFIGKELGELGGRVFVDVTQVKGPIDFYEKTIGRLLYEVEATTPTTMPEFSTNKFWFDNDAKNKLGPLRNLYIESEKLLKTLALEMEMFSGIVHHKSLDASSADIEFMEEVFQRRKHEINDLKRQIYQEKKAILDGEPPVDNKKRVDGYVRELDSAMKNIYKGITANRMAIYEELAEAKISVSEEKKHKEDSPQTPPERPKM